MRALVIHPISNYNIGDLLTYRGTQEILRAVDPDIEFLMFDMWRAERELNTYMSEFYWGAVDIIVLAGSPWLWFGLGGSPKYKILSDAIKRFAHIPKIALGIGSCFPLDFLALEKVDKEMLLSSGSYETLVQTLGIFDLILTRDILAQRVLEGIGIESFFGKDTSWYAKSTFYSSQNISKRPLCIFQDPQYSLSKDGLDAAYIEFFLQRQITYIKAIGAEIYTISAEDAYSAKELGFEARYVADLDWMAKHVSNRPAVLSGRVHMALLAHMMGSSNVEVLPLDSRYLTLAAFPQISIGRTGYHHFEAVEAPLEGYNEISEEILKEKIKTILRS